MKQKYSFIAATYNLEISKVLNKGIQLNESPLRISNSDSLQNIVDDFFEYAIGGMEFKQLKNGPYYYAKGVIDSIDNLHEGQYAHKLIDYYLVQVQIFNNILWLIKDHSINTEFGFLKVEDTTNRTTHSNIRTTTFYNARGLKEKVIFNAEELLKAKELNEKIFIREKQFKGFELKPQITETIYSSKRIERSFYFLEVARSESFLPLRISNFVTVFETLLSTSSSEVTHKLRERLAWILGENIDERIHIFKLVGDVYSIRSNCVHGNTMPKRYRTEEKITDLCVEVEQLVRTLLLKMITDEDLYALYDKDNDEEIEKWLNEKCLGK
ncbi:hypothetical protein [Solibacillus sp. FSL K6-1554]|uniref:hypothetical protein n=1 Tax=Solibacillus sp. FSL K6-1554 TaxID=2921472 RepID=UPI0030FC5291